MASKQTLALAVIGGMIVLLLVEGVINVLWPQSRRRLLTRGRMNVFDIQLFGIMNIVNAILAFYLFLLPILEKIRR